VRASDPTGLHRVLDEAVVLPQAAQRLDTRKELWPDEVRIRVERLNLDAASFRQLELKHQHDGNAVRREVLEIVASRGKMQNPETGSGGMLVGTVEEVGPESPLGLEVGDRVATLVSLTLTPLQITDGLAAWDGQSEQVPCEGHAILFARSIAAVLPEDLSAELSLAVMDVCGAPALTSRVVRKGSVVLIIGAAGKSGSLSAAAARQAGAAKVIGVVPTEKEAALLRNPATTQDEGAGGMPTDVRPRPAADRRAPQSPLVDAVVIADARDPVGLAQKVEAAGGPADVTVVCVDVAGCEGGAILSTRQGGTVIFFSMATSFSAAALGAEGLAADVTMLVGNGYVPGHADFALDLIRTTPSVRQLFERRVTS